jgi:hypothetical protein
VLACGLRLTVVVRDEALEAVAEVEGAHHVNRIEGA